MELNPFRWTKKTSTPLLDTLWGAMGPFVTEEDPAEVDVYHGWRVPQLGDTGVLQFVSGYPGSSQLMEQYGWSNKNSPSHPHWVGGFIESK